MLPEKDRKVGAIANKFIQHARYRLTPREQKLIIYMSSFIKPEDSDFDTYLVPVSDLESVFRDDEDKKHGSFYERLDDLLDSITDKKISFPTEFELEGRRMRGHINWVSGAVPRKDKRGVLCVEFGFSPQMKPFMLGLREKFTKIELLEVARMTSGFSIRIFQICKSYYYEHAKYGRNVYKTGVENLKAILGIEDKYPDFRNFRRKVLNVAKDEINAKTGLEIEYEFVRQGRRIGEIHITNEALILTYTDGLTDVRNEEGDFLDETFGHRFMLDHYKLNAAAFNTELMETINLFKGNTGFPDDLTVLTCKIY